MITLSDTCGLIILSPCGRFSKNFPGSHLILTVQSSITNIVSGRPDATSISRHQALSFPLQTDMRPDNSVVIV